MATFRKPTRRNIRKKAAASDEEGEMSNDEDKMAPVVAVGAGVKKKKAKEVRRSTLSFDDEGDDPALMKKAKLKPQKSDHKVRKHDDHRVGAMPALYSQSTGAYTKEALAELRKGTRSLVSSGGGDGEKPIKMVGLFEGSGGATTTKVTAPSDEGNIPTEAQIKFAKERRERMRQEQEFIPLDSKLVEKETGGKWGESRQIREDIEDQDEFDDDETGKIVFGMAAARRQERDRARALVAATEEENFEAGGEDRDDFERDQMAKGGAAGRKAQGKGVDQAASTTAEMASKGATWEAEQVEIRDPEVVMRELQETLTQLREQHALSQIEVEELADKLQRTGASLLDGEEHMEGLSEQYTYYQEMRTYVNNLLDCLEDKVTQIDGWEDRLDNGLRRRGEARRTRRLQDERDETAEADAGCKGISLAYGGVAEAERQERAEKRSQRRAGAAAAGAKVGWSEVEVDGATSDEDDDEMSLWHETRGSVVEEARGLFEDTVEEYRSTQLVWRRFCAWKAKYPKAYRDAYVSLCLPKLFSVYVRLQMLGWQPLTEGGHVLDDQPWVSDLFEDDEMQTDDEAEQDADAELIPTLVKNVVAPKLETSLTHEWNVYSSHSTKYAVAAVKETTIFLIDAHPTAVSSLCGSVKSILLATLSNYPMLDTFSPRDATTSPQFLINRRRFHRLVKLCCNVCLWEGVISRPILQSLVEQTASPRLASYILLLSLPGASLDALQTVLDCFPSAWLESEGRPVKFLTPLADALHKIHGRFKAAAPPGKAAGDALRLAGRLSKTMRRIGSVKMAEQVEREYRL